MNKHIRRCQRWGVAKGRRDGYCDTRARIRGWVSESERMAGKGVRVR